MKISTKFSGDIAVISLSGPMMGGPDTVAFHDIIKTNLDHNIKRFIVDLGKVKWMNSSGLGVLMAAFGSVCRVEGVIKLVNVTKKVRSLLIIVQIITFFETYDDIESAINSFS
jgi:anti-sigma B factor antagonist